MPARLDPLTQHSRVPAWAHGMPVADYLLRRFPYHDRVGWEAELAAGRIQIDGRRAGHGSRLRGGEDLAYTRLHREPWVDDRIEVLHDDEDLLVVAKPAHLPMHADGPFVRATLIQLLRERCAAPKLALVHRLDRETSGVCVVPRTDPARRALHEQFERGLVRKLYHAVVHGDPAAQFEVAAPIGRANDSRIALRRATGPSALDPQPARTEFVLARRGPARALLQCIPHSGRTHQIRVHLASVGLPIVGDRLYGRSDDDYLAFVRTVKQTGDPRGVLTDGVDRHLLHASTLAFAHPRTGRDVEFTAPLPPLFATAVAGEPPGASATS